MIKWPLICNFFTLTSHKKLKNIITIYFHCKKII